MSSFNVKAVLLHGAAASVMAWGFVELKSVPADKWIRQQKGGHFQFLTILGLCAAWLTMMFALGADVLPSVKIFRRLKRTLFMIALPVASIVSPVYWGLLLFAPNMILQPIPVTVPSSSKAAPELMRVPLPLDLALHASPVISLLVDFFFFETKYPRTDAVYGGIIICAVAGVAYGSWSEWLASHNGGFPYPFLTDNTPAVRKMIYAGLDSFALVVFWALNALHA